MDAFHECHLRVFPQLFARLPTGTSAFLYRHPTTSDFADRKLGRVSAPTECGSPSRSEQPGTHVLNCTIYESTQLSLPASLPPRI